MPAKRADENSIALGKMIRTLRERKGWSQAEVAAKLTPLLRSNDDPIDQTLITRWETGRRGTSATDLGALSDVFGIPIDVLLRGTDPLWEPEGWAEWAAWEARARLDAARDRLERAARDYGEVRAAFENQDQPEDSAAMIAEQFELEGWNAEVDRQNG